MKKLKYSKGDDGEHLANVGDAVKDLDDGERMILWQALTIWALRAKVKKDSDTLHLFFWKRDDQWWAQVDRKDPENVVEHLMSWRGEIDAEDRGMTWRMK